MHYREGQYVRKGDPLVDIDARPYAAQLAQAQGLLERDKNRLQRRRWIMDRYKEAWAKNAIPRQTLEDQEKLVLQDQGTVKNDQGTVQYDQVQVRLLPHYIADFGTSRSATCGPWQPGDSKLDDNSRGGCPDAADHGYFHAGRRQPAAGSAALEGGKQLQVELRPDAAEAPGDGQAHHNRQPDRYSDFGHGQTAGCNSTIRRENFCKSVCEHAFAGEYADESDADSILGYSAQRKHRFCVFDRQQQGHDAYGEVGNTDKGNTAVQGLQPGDVVANSSFEKLQNGSQITVSKVKLPSGSDSAESEVP